MDINESFEVQVATCRTNYGEHAQAKNAAKMQKGHISPLLGAPNCVPHLTFLLHVRAHLLAAVVRGEPLSLETETPFLVSVHMTVLLYFLEFVCLSPQNNRSLRVRSLQ